MEVEDRLDELAILIEEAKAMPLSASCIVNRAQVLDIIDEIRGMLPESMSRANAVLADREAVVSDGKREADRILARAKEDQERMVSEHEVYEAAVDAANQLRFEVDQETSRMRAETDDYIDAKLAMFEITLTKTLGTVERGRDRIRGHAYDNLPPENTGEVRINPDDPDLEDTGVFDQFDLNAR